MFDSERENREWRFYVQDMLVFGEKVLSYSDGLNYEAFVADGLTYDANLTQHPAYRAEAATHIPDRVFVMSRIQKFHGGLSSELATAWSMPIWA